MMVKYANIIVLIGAFGALWFALITQYGFGYHPCELCILQRWVYAAVILFSLLTLGTKKRIVKLLVSLALFVEIIAAAYHFGIEQKWWEGFQSCSSGLDTGLTIDQLRDKIMNAPSVRCDEATWFFLGLSMAGWNVLYASGLFIISSFSSRKSA